MVKVLIKIKNVDGYRRCLVPGRNRINIYIFVNILSCFPNILIYILIWCISLVRPTDIGIRALNPVDICINVLSTR